jgi:hypothetical protein
LSSAQRLNAEMSGRRGPTLIDGALDEGLSGLGSTEESCQIQGLRAVPWRKRELHFPVVASAEEACTAVHLWAISWPSLFGGRAQRYEIKSFKS